MTILPKNWACAQIAETIKDIISVVVTCIGLAIIVIGLNYAMDIFQLIFTTLKSPQYLTDPIHQMAQIISGSALSLKLEGAGGFMINIMALAVYSGGAILCAWLTLAMMHTGAKIVSLNMGDRSAVKKILQNAFGNRLQPKGTAEVDKIKTRDTSPSQS